MDEKNLGKEKQVNINVPANGAPILYTDSIFISSNQFGIILNVAQSLDDNNQQIVTRIGMSREHALAFIEVLAKHMAITSKGKTKQ